MSPRNELLSPTAQSLSLSRLVALLRACVIAYAAAACVAAAAASVRVNFNALKFYNKFDFYFSEKTSILLINFPWRHKFCCCCCCVTENPNKIMSTLLLPLPLSQSTSTPHQAIETRSAVKTHQMLHTICIIFLLLLASRKILNK